MTYSMDEIMAKFADLERRLAAIEQAKAAPKPTLTERFVGKKTKGAGGE